jgi:nitroreductase
MENPANPVIEAIITRRSIRHYIRKNVDKSLIELLLKSAMYAPSARNEQPWHFIVIDRQELFKRIMKVHPYSSMLSEAAAAILVCGDEKLELSRGYWPVDCSAATQNILLAAHSLGLGSVWLGVYPRKERMDGIRDIFMLPDHIRPFSLVSIGYPSERKEIPERFREDRVSWNLWAEGA